MNSVIRWGYVPLLLLGVNGVGLALVAGGASKLTLVMLLAIAIALSFAAERALPYEPAWNDDHGDASRDVVHAAVNELSATASVLALPAIASFATVFDVWPVGLPLVVQVVAAVLVFDLGITVCHWLSHRWGPLWRLHAVHHSVTRSYGLNGLMKHPLHQALELTFAITPLVLIGLPQEVAWALALLVAIQLLLQHSNVDYRVGPLAGWLALNQGHRFHHLRLAGDGDVNFGLFTLIWDRLLLHTYVSDPGRRFTSDDLGIAAQPTFPKGYVEQLLKPWRW